MLEGARLEAATAPLPPGKWPWLAEAGLKPIGFAPSFGACYSQSILRV